jgi:hypothetical protein
VQSALSICIQRVALIAHLILEAVELRFQGTNHIRIAGVTMNIVYFFGVHFQVE